MKPTFAQGFDQNFLQSPCQNRVNNGVVFSIQTDLNWLNDYFPGAYAPLVAGSYNDELEANFFVPGTIVENNTGSFSWTITWQGSLCGTRANGKINYLNQAIGGIYLNGDNRRGFLIVGPPTIARGTFALHASAGGGMYEPAYETIYVNGVETFGDFNGGVPWTSGTPTDIVVFWIGRTPSDLPSANFSPSTYSLAIVPNGTCP